MAGAIQERMNGGVHPETLFTPDTLSTPPEQRRYSPVFLPIQEVNILPQARVVFEGLDELAVSLAKDGQINPPFIARWTPEEAQRYITVVNLITGSHVKLEDLQAKTIDGEEKVDVLLAGERRVRAGRTMLEKPCDHCSARLQASPSSGSCYDTHYPNGFEFRMGLKLTPQEAIAIQTAENLHEKPKPWEEAPYIRNYWVVSKLENPNLSLKDYATHIRRGQDTVRDALRFSRLSDETQQHVREGRLPYSVATQLARLKEEGVSDEMVKHYEIQALMGHLSPGTLIKTMDTYLKNIKDGRMFTGGLFDEQANQRGMVVTGLDRVVSAATRRQFDEATTVLTRIAQLLNAGQLSTPFKDPDVIRIVRHSIVTTEGLLPAMLDSLPPHEATELRERIGVHKVVADMLLRNSLAEN